MKRTRHRVKVTMRWITKTVLMVLALVLVFVWVEIARSPGGEDKVGIYFFDVGQGDASLIQKESYQILIDGGPDDKILTELGKVMPLIDREIETVILSHPHADHLTGLNQVLDRYKVNKIYASGVLHTSDGYLEFLQKVKDKEIEMKIPAIGESMIPYDNAKLEFLWPGDQYKEKTIDNINNSSLIERFCYFDQCALMTGDIEVDEQERMFNFYQDSMEDKFGTGILKLPHHGSSNGSFNSIYTMVAPSFSIVSAGADNKYGHPHKAALDLAEKYRSKILRTDRDGTIKFVLGKEGIMQLK